MDWWPLMSNRPHERRSLRSGLSGPSRCPLVGFDEFLQGIREEMALSLLVLRYLPEKAQQLSYQKGEGGNDTGGI